MADQTEVNDYLLGELDEARRARFEARLAEDPELAARVAALRSITAGLDGLPASAWQFVERQHQTASAPPQVHAAAGDRVTRPGRADALLGRGGRSADARARRVPGWRRKPLPRGGVAGLAGALAVAALLAVLLAGVSSPAMHTVVLRALPGAPSDSRATATISGSRRITVTVQNLPVTDNRHHYELWLMTSTTDLVPVAAFRVDRHGDARLALALPAPAQRYRYLDVSLERAGAGAAISGDSVLRGPTAAS